MMTNLSGFCAHAQPMSLDLYLYFYAPVFSFVVNFWTPGHLRLGIFSKARLDIYMAPIIQYEKTQYSSYVPPLSVRLK